MPIDRYFKGHGSEVMANMKSQYGNKKGESVFYATANKNKKMKPKAPNPHEALAAKRK